MRDNSNLYRKLSNEKIRELRSKKFVRLQKIENIPGSYLIRQEREALKHQIHQIDVEINARFLQLTLLP